MEIKREFVELNPQPLGRPKTKHIKIIIETHAYLSRLTHDITEQAQR